MSVMVFFFELVEGKYQSKERGKPYFEADYKATGGMMMRTTNPLFGTGKDVVTDSDVCVLKGLVGILVHRLYRITVTNKIYIGPSTAREMPLRYASETRRLGIFMLFLVICIGTSK